MASCINFKIFRKTSPTFEVKFKINGYATNIDGWTVLYTLKEKISDTDDNAKIKKDITTHTDSTGGITLIELSRDDTDIAPGSYYYDVKYVDDEGNGDIIIYGRLTIMKSVTQRA